MRIYKYHRAKKHLALKYRHTVTQNKRKFTLNISNNKASATAKHKIAVAFLRIRYFNKHSNTISFLLLVAIMVGGMVFADADSSEALRATFSTIIKMIKGYGYCVLGKA